MWITLYHTNMYYIKTKFLWKVREFYQQRKKKPRRIRSMPWVTDTVDLKRNRIYYYIIAPHERGPKRKGQSYLRWDLINRGNSKYLSQNIRSHHVTNIYQSIFSILQEKNSIVSNLLTRKWNCWRNNRSIIILSIWGK